MEKEINYNKEVNKVGIVTIVGNVILTLGKVVAGILAGSGSLISDGVHSGSDVLSTIIVMIGSKLSNKKPDKDHPFGHERLESIACIILAMLLFGTAFLLGYNGVLNIIEYAKGNVPTINPSFVVVALSFAIASIVIKFAMFVYSYVVSKKINSVALKADSFHHLSDSLSSIGSVLGIVGMMIGGKWAILDPIACVVIALFILKVAFDIALEAINQVVDKAAPKEYEEKVQSLVSACENVISINSLKTRQFGNKYYVEVEIVVDANITVKAGHDIAKNVHDTIEQNCPDVKHCMVHVDPSK